MLEALKSLLDYVAAIILSILPDSPFQPFINQLETAGWVKALNWVIPVGTFITAGTAWLTAIGVFYAYQMILRWAKAVGD